MPDRLAVVSELYRRRDGLPAEKAAVVTELARRLQIDDATGPIPDVGGRGRDSILGRVGQQMGGGNPHLIAGGLAEAREGFEQLFDPSWDEKAGGVHKIVSGLSSAAAPAAVTAGLVLAPEVTIPALAIGSLASYAGSGVARQLGASQNVSDVIGDVAGFAAGGKAGELAPRAGRAAVNRAAGALREGILPRSGTVTQQIAANWALRRGAPLDAAAATHNPLLRGAQEASQTTLGSGAMARRAIEKRNTWYTDTGRSLAAETFDTPQSPETAGQAIADAATAAIRSANRDAAAEYQSLRQRELDPANIKRLKVGTRKAESSTLVTESGDPLVTEEPVHENIALPVDMRPFKEQFRPQLRAIGRQTRLGQSHYAPAQIALEDIVHGPDYVAASTAEKNLGALKQVSMKGTLAGGVKTEAGGLAAASIEQLQSAIDASVKHHAGADALAELQRGRDLTFEKYKAIELVDQFKAEPVRLFQQLTGPRDTSIGFLRQVQELAPQEVPRLGRAWLDGAIDHASEQGGFHHADKLFADWSKLGPETKKILFPEAEHRADLDHFFQSAKDSARIENPSGTAKVAHLTSQGAMLIANPVAGGAYLVAGNLLSRLLYSPRFVRAAIRGFELPARAPKGVAMSAAVRLAEAAKAAGVPLEKSSGISTNDPAAVAPSEGVSINGRTPTGAARQGTALPEAAGAGARTGVRAPGDAGSASSTTIAIPGSAGEGYRAQYRLRELSEVQTSHQGATFQPNTKYGLTNDRDYANPLNQGKIIHAAGSKFDPALHITDNPDATNGPLVIDSAGNVIGGNGRGMMLQRVYAQNGKAAAAYREMLTRKAAQFGLDPAAAAQMKQPVLVREIADSEFGRAGRSKQNAVTDFNKVGTNSLTPGERAIADSRRVSNGTLDEVAGRLEAKGPDAGLAEILQGKPGGEILQKLIDDGVVAAGERGELMTKDGELTGAGKDRITRLVVGRFFESPQQYETIAPSVRHQVERIAAPLAQVETSPAWSLTEAMRDAISLLEDAQKRGPRAGNLDDFIAQDGLFGAQKWSPRAVTLARALKGMKAAELKAAARQYASDAGYADKGPSMFGDAPAPEASFAAAFGETPANALAPTSGAQSKGAK